MLTICYFLQIVTHLIKHFFKAFCVSSGIRMSKIFSIFFRRFILGRMEKPTKFFYLFLSSIIDSFCIGIALFVTHRHNMIYKFLTTAFIYDSFKMLSKHLLSFLLRFFILNQRINCNFSVFLTYSKLLKMLQ